MNGDNAALTILLSSALLMFWLLPASAWWMLRGRQDGLARLWFTGTFVYALGASAYVLGPGAEHRVNGPLISGLALLSVMLMLEALRREHRPDHWSAPRYLALAGLWTIAQGVVAHAGHFHVVGRAAHLVAMTGVDTLIVLNALALHRRFRSRSLLVISGVFAAFCVVNVLRVAEAVFSNRFPGLLSFSWLSSAALMINYLSVMFYSFGYWGFVLDKESQARQALSEDLIRSRKEELEQQARAELAEVINREREQLYGHLLNISKFAQSSALAATISHELNQPLATVRLDLESALSGVRAGRTTEQIIPLLERAHQSNLMASEVIRRLRAMFGAARALPETRSLDDIVESCLSLCHHALAASRVRLTSHLAAGRPLQVNRGELEHAVLNLLANAREAASGIDEAWIEVKTEQDAERTCLHIRNSGPLIAPGLEETLFELFRSSKSEGLGLGLWLARHIAQRHSGRLFLDREDRDATRFTLEIPNKARPVEASRAAASVPTLAQASA